MPNMSNKNFPHAHGAGRVIAAFQLSHPGAGSTSIQAPFSPGAADMQALPPVLANPPLGSVFPYPDVTVTPESVEWGIYRQPYNATSIGVYVQGSGTRRLPYTESLLPGVPGYISPLLNQEIPTTDLYSFETVDKTQLGKTHAQVVCSAVGDTGGCGGPPAVLEGAGQTAYYEVGLNWDIPPITFEFSTGVPELWEKLNWANNQIASVQRALERTFWVSASVTTNALSEWHPAGDYSPFSSIDGNAIAGPLDGSVTSPTAPDGMPGGTGGMASPYGYHPSILEQVTSPVQPAYAPTGNQVDDAFRTRGYGLQTQVAALVTSYSTRSIDGGARIVGTLKLAPVVRIWVMQPASPVDGGAASEYWAPLPIPRSGLGAYLTDFPNDTSVIPSIGVQVVQKNSSAVDGTDGPVYDLGIGWGELGAPSAQTAPSQPRKRTQRSPAWTPKKPEIT